MVSHTFLVMQNKSFCLEKVAATWVQPGMSSWFHLSSHIVQEIIFRQEFTLRFVSFSCIQCLCSIFHILASWRILLKAEVGEVVALGCPLCCHLFRYYILRVYVGLLDLCLACGWLTFFCSCRVEDLAMGVFMEPWRISIRLKGLVACSVGSQQRCCGMHPSLASTWCSTHRPKTWHLKVRLNVGGWSGECSSSQILPCSWQPACSACCPPPQKLN